MPRQGCLEPVKKSGRLTEVQLLLLKIFLHASKPATSFSVKSGVSDTMEDSILYRSSEFSSEEEGFFEFDLFGILCFYYFV